MSASSMPSSLTIALEQIAAEASWEHNLGHCLQALRRGAQAGAHIVVLPEACMRPFGTDLQDLPSNLDSVWQEALQGCAKDLGIVAIVGIFRRKGASFTNTLLVTGQDLLATYDKRHLYDAFGYEESRLITRGKDCLLLSLGSFCLGFGLCYDLRFPEHFLTLALHGANVLIVAADWGLGPGKLEQWRLLTRARALDCTAYLVACGQAKNPQIPAFGLGHSLCVAPNGEIIDELGEAEGELVVQLDLACVRKVREHVPVLTLNQKLFSEVPKVQIVFGRKH